MVCTNGSHRRPGKRKRKKAHYDIGCHKLDRFTIANALKLEYQHVIQYSRSQRYTPTAEKSQAHSIVEKENNIVWFAMSAPYRRERIAKEFLESKGIECFVPMKTALVEKRNGTKQRQLVPAIHNLVFVHTDKETIKTLKQGVNFLQYHTRPVNGKNVPIIVPDSQMQQFIAVTQAGNDSLTYLRPDEIDLAKGTKVRVHGGAFDGTEGFFVKVQGKRSRRVVLLIEGITAVALAEISSDFIEVIG